MGAAALTVALFVLWVLVGGGADGPGPAGLDGTAVDATTEASRPVHDGEGAVGRDAPDIEADTPAPLPAPGDVVEASAAVAWPAGVVEIALSGRVVDLRGDAWPGATVVFVPDRRTSLDLDGLPGGPPDRSHETPLADLPRVTTSADGRFSLRGPWQSQPGGRSRFQDLDPSVVITAEGMAWQGHPAPGFRGRSMDLGDLVLAQPGAGLSLRVLDERGAPLAGVRAIPFSTSFQSGADDDPMPPGRMANGFMGMTDDDGRLQMAHAWPSKVNFSLKKEGFEELTLRAVFPPGGHEDLGDVVLTAGRSLSGTVRDTLGKPVPGAQVMALSSDMAERALQAAPAEIDLTAVLLRRARSSPLQAVSAVDGSFVLGGISSNVSSVSLFALAEGFATLRADALTPGRGGLELVLLPEAELSVDVRSASNGAPLPGAQVQALVRTGFPEDPHPAFLRETYLPLVMIDWRVMQPGVLGTILFVAAAEHLPQRIEVPPMAPGEQHEVVVVLEPGATVMGRVVDEVGQPVEGAAVGLSPEAGVLDRLMVLPEVLTDADGRFVLPPLPACRWTGSVDKAGYVQADLDVIDGTAPAAALEVTLVRAARVTGTLVDAAGSPAVAHWLTATRRDDAPGVTPVSSRARTDRDGYFELQALERGVWELRAEPGAEARVTLEPGDTEDVLLQLTQRLRLTGRTRSESEPLSQVKVGANLLDPEEPERVTQRVSTRSGVDGRFALELPEPGEYSLYFASRQGPWVRQSLVVNEGDAPDLDVDFGTGGLAGHVVLGAPGATMPRQVSIRVSDAEHYRGSVEADADGRFVFAPLPAGSYQLGCSPNMMVPVQTPFIELGPGERIEDIEIVLKPAAEVIGFVRHEDGDLFSGWAHLRRTDGTPGYHVTDVDEGEFERDGLSPGAWRLDLTTFEEPLLGHGEGFRGEPGVELPFIAERQFDLVGGQTLRMDLVAQRVEEG